MNCTSNNPAKIQRNATIAQDRLSGMVYSEIAKKHGIDKGTVSRVLNDAEIKDIIETGTKQMVAMVPRAIDNYRVILSDKEHSDHYKATKDCLTITGIAPSRTGNTFINNVFYQDNRQQISSGIAEIIRYQRDQQEAEEAEFEVIDE